MSPPSSRIVPAVGISKPAIIRSVVVLPQPDGPRKLTNSPFSAPRLKSSTATVAPKCFCTPVSTRKLIGRSPPAAAGPDARAPAAGPAADEGDDDHGEPRQAEADQRD